jgi:hypothetical protein
MWEDAECGVMRGNWLMALLEMGLKSHSLWADCYEKALDYIVINEYHDKECVNTPIKSWV